MESVPVFPYTFKVANTTTTFTITDGMTIKPDTVSGIKFPYVLTTMENYKFGTNFNAPFNQEKMAKLRENPENHSKMLNYLYDKPMSIDEDVKLSDYEKLIVKIYNSVFETIKSSLTTKIYEQSSTVAAPPPRCVPSMGRVPSQASPAEYSAYHGSAPY
jgi:hypothetical protein